MMIAQQLGKLFVYSIKYLCDYIDEMNDISRSQHALSSALKPSTKSTVTMCTGYLQLN